MKRTILITGASKGIGLAIAERLASKNYTVIGIARNSIASEFPGQLFLADLADVKSSTEVFKEINEKYTVDALINNVGSAIPGRLSEISLEDFNFTINLNLRSFLQATQFFAPNMLKNSWGRIINMSSRAILGLDNRSLYSASKAGVIGFTRSWALELAQTGITVNAIAPGPIETEAYRLHRPLGSIEAQNSLKNVPMGRVGKPVEIAAAAEFLLSEDAGFITGQTLFVDGGASIGLVH